MFGNNNNFVRTFYTDNVFVYNMFSHAVWIIFLDRQCYPDNVFLWKKLYRKGL